MATAETRALAAPTADNIANRIDRLPFLPFHLRIAGILGTGTMFDAFDSLSMGAALTMMGASFALGFKTGGYLISAAFAGQFVGAILFGYVGERIGRTLGPPVSSVEAAHRGARRDALRRALHTPELYPTRMRAWATSTGSSLNRLGSFIAPLIVGWMLAG